MEKLYESGWIKKDNTNYVEFVINFKQLLNLAGKV